MILLYLEGDRWELFLTIRREVAVEALESAPNSIGKEELRSASEIKDLSYAAVTPTITESS